MDEKRESAIQKKRQTEQNHGKTSDLGMYSYQLVLFSNENSEGLLNIECVPHGWLDYSEETKMCVSKYMPPPYTKIKTALLTKMIKEKDDPDKDWPTYPIEIRGQAETYADALEKLKVLRKEQYVFTSEPDTTKAETSRRLHKIVQKNRLKQGGIGTLMQFPDDMSSSSETEVGISVDSPMEKFGEMSSDENQNASTAVNHNTHRISQKGDTYTAKLAFEHQNKSIPKKRSDNRISNRENIPPKKYHQQPRKPASFNYFKVADLARSIPVLKETTKSKLYSSGERIVKDKYSKGVTAKLKNIHDPERSYEADHRDKNMHETIISEHSTPKSRHNPFVVSDDPPPSTSSMKHMQKWKDDYESIRYDINKMKKDILTIKDLLIQALENVPGLTHLTFDDKYPQDIPFKTMAAFKHFDVELMNDKELQKEFIQSLQLAINSIESISKIIVNILKKWFSKEVAMEFTAVKMVGEKIVMKDTQFCKCLLKAFDIKRAADPNLTVLSEKQFYDKLGAVLGNARDWMGHRLHSGKKNKRNTETT